MATTSSSADKGRRTRLINEAIKLTVQKAEVEIRLKAIKQELGRYLDENLNGSKTITLPTRKGVCEVTRVETVTIPERLLQGMQQALRDRFEQLVSVETKYKITPALRRILEDPGPQEQDLSAEVEKYVERKTSSRYTFRVA